jgi:hypothetical protein
MRTWQRFLKDAEAVLLPYFDCAPAGVFSPTALAGHIWRRTQGYVGDTALLLSQALLAAFDDGSDTITTAHLDDVPLSARAAAGEVRTPHRCPQVAPSRRRSLKVTVTSRPHRSCRCAPRRTPGSHCPRMPCAWPTPTASTVAGCCPGGDTTSTSRQRTVHESAPSPARPGRGEAADDEPVPVGVRGHGPQRRHGWRLHHSVTWICPSCTPTTGRRDLLWQTALMPVCLRCGCYLVRARHLGRAVPRHRSRARAGRGPSPSSPTAIDNRVPGSVLYRLRRRCQARAATDRPVTPSLVASPAAH